MTLFATPGILLVGTNNTNASMTRGVTINLASETGEAFAIQQNGSNHGVTSLAETQTFFDITYQPQGLDIVQLRGFGEVNTAIQVLGITSAASTLKSSSAAAPVATNAALRSGTTTTAIGSNGNLFVVTNSGQTRFIVDAEGDVHVDGSGSLTVYDDHDDVKLLTAARAVLMPDGDFKRRYAEWIEQYAPVLSAGKVITLNEDGHHFVSHKGMTGLIIDTIRQMAQRIEELEGVVYGT
jgi:hypothetical protein